MIEGQSRRTGEWRWKPYATRSPRIFHVSANLPPKDGTTEGGALPNPESEGWALVPELSSMVRTQVTHSTLWSLAGPVVQVRKLTLTSQNSCEEKTKMLCKQPRVV